MSFSAECPFCHLTLQGVPDQRLGYSVECPRCRNSFTLAPLSAPVRAATRGPRFAPARPFPVTAPQTSAPEQRQAIPAPVVEPVVQDNAVGGEPDPEAQPTPAALPSLSPRLVPDHAGVAAFALGSFAFLAAALTHRSLLTLTLGLAGLLFGMIGFFVSLAKQRRPLLASAGTVVSLSAVIVTVFLPSWLGLNSLLGPPPQVQSSGMAALALTGRGDFRRAVEGEELWVDASQDALHLGDVRLRIRSAIVGVPEFVPVMGKRPPSERCLLLGLRISNAGLTRKIPYTGWGRDQAEDRPSLRDDQGKSYAEKTFGPGWIVKGRAASATIPLGKSLDDVLVFAPPPATIRSLRLELPGATVGVNGTFRMEVPRNMIVFR